MDFLFVENKTTNQNQSKPVEINDSGTDNSNIKDSDSWKACAPGEHIRMEKDLAKPKDLSPEAINLGCGFLVALQERNNDLVLEIIAKIKKLATVWRNKS